MGTVAIVCKLPARPGGRPALLAELNRIALVADGEEGTESYVVMSSADDPDLVVLFEVFADAAAYESHRADPVHQEVVARLPELLGDEGELLRLQPVGRARLGR